jgi:hypothetical protein
MLYNKNPKIHPNPPPNTQVNTNKRAIHPRYDNLSVHVSFGSLGIFGSLGRIFGSFGSFGTF